MHPSPGSKGAAEKSQLVYYVGGDPAVFERVKPVLEATSRAIVHCGKIGDAAVLKVATNMITAVTTQTLAEALAITRKCGIAPEAFGAAIQQNCLQERSRRFEAAEDADGGLFAALLAQAHVQGRPARHPAGELIATRDSRDGGRPPVCCLGE
jgi:3-hydroxyisobutyrate dehydrogenase-like beta-hydroxyacid dehydrogenase